MLLQSLPGGIPPGSSQWSRILDQLAGCWDPKSPVDSEVRVIALSAGVLCYPPRLVLTRVQLVLHVW